MMCRSDPRGLLAFLARSVFLFVAACLVPASGWASANSKINPHLLRRGIPAVADFDGDKIKDIASGVKVGQTERGYVYRVDLDLSSSSASSPFLIYSTEFTELNVEAIDVDRDNDLDLVVTGRLAAQPSGIWINDGKGRFNEGDAARYHLGHRQQRELLVVAEAIPTSAGLSLRQLRIVPEGSSRIQSLPPAVARYSPLKYSR